MLGIVGIIQVEAPIVIVIWNRVVLCASYVQLMEFDEGVVGSLGTNTIWFYGCLCPNRLNSEQVIFIMNQMNRNRDIL